MDARSNEKFLNLPNCLTLLRAGLVPVFLILVFQKKVFGMLLVFSLAGLTDVLDGMTARLWHLRTRMGTILDPLADKFLLSTAYILLSFKSLGFLYIIPFWLTATILSRDFIILAGSLVIYKTKGRKDFYPSVFGKISTVLQVVTIFWVLLANYVQASSWRSVAFLSSLTSPSLLSALYIVTLASTLVSGAHYILKGIRMQFSPR